MVLGHLRPSQHGAHYLASWSMKVPRIFADDVTVAVFIGAREGGERQKDSQRGYHAPGNAASPGFPSLCVHANHAFDGAAADGAKTDLVAGEHDAILQRAVVAAPFIHGSFKRADLARVEAGAEDPCRHDALFAEQRFHVGFRPVLRADGAPALLDRLLHLLELLLRPDGGQIDAGGQQIFPFRGAWVCGSVRFPRFGMFRHATVGDIGRIVFVGQPREMVAEFVHENVGRERVVGGDGGEEIEDAAAPILAVVDHDLDEFVRRGRRRLAQPLVVEREDVALRPEGVIRGARGEWRKMPSDGRATPLSSAGASTAQTLKS
jgi:hypothetical protein